MPLTLDEILQFQERLEHEIVERECLLASLRVLQKYVGDGKNPKSFDLRSALPSSTLLLGTSAEQLPAPPNPPPPAPTPYIHPELEAIPSGYRTNVAFVWWAIRRMTNDFSLHDIAALLKREGNPLRTAEISVVLTRLKRRGELEEIRRSYGPKPALFRNPNQTSAVDAQAANQAAPPASTSVAAAA